MEKSKDQYIEELASKIMSFLNSNEENLTFDCMPFGFIEKALTILDYKYLEMDTTGWQVDYWAFFKKNKTHL